MMSDCIQATHGEFTLNTVLYTVPHIYQQQQHCTERNSPLMGTGHRRGTSGEMQSRDASSVGMSLSPGKRDFSMPTLSSPASSGEEEEMMVAGDWSLALGTDRQVTLRHTAQGNPRKQDELASRLKCSQIRGGQAASWLFNIKCIWYPIHVKSKVNIF